MTLSTSFAKAFCMQVQHLFSFVLLEIVEVVIILNSPTLSTHFVLQLLLCDDPLHNQSAIKSRLETSAHFGPRAENFAIFFCIFFFLFLALRWCFSQAAKEKSIILNFISFSKPTSTLSRLAVKVFFFSRYILKIIATAKKLQLTFFSCFYFYVVLKHTQTQRKR